MGASVAPDVSRSPRQWRRAARYRGGDGRTSRYAVHRKALMRDLTGTVLEIGAGAGANVVFVPSGVRWIGLEPNPYLRDRLRQAAARLRDAHAVAGTAERIPLADGTVDVVVSTLVLCSVADQDRVLAEVRRVLRPGGRFVFCEHVAAPRGTWSRRGQRLIAPITRRFDAGCDPARETGAAIERAGFERVRMDWFTLRELLVVNTPNIVGHAIA